MLRIRLRRTGARKKPQYRLVIAESTSPRDGRYIEIIGTYNPLTNPSTVKIDAERAQHWLSVGATPSDRVHKLLANEGLMEQPKFVTAAKAASADGAATAGASAGASDDAASGTAAVAGVAATSAAMAPAAEEAGASGPVPDADDAAGAPATAEAPAAEATDEATAEAAATPDAASEAV